MCQLQRRDLLHRRRYVILHIVFHGFPQSIDLLRLRYPGFSDVHLEPVDLLLQVAL